MSSKLLYIIVLLYPFLVNGQSFINGNLDGFQGYENLPSNWASVPFNDPICQANTVAQATVDMLDSTGPSLSGGVAGNPNSTPTFCSGLHASDGGASLWHEGIMQSVSGFIIGEEYTISFYQSVVKQSNCLDESGSWQVYVDNQLIGTSAPSISNLAATDINLQWENRTLSFTAQANSHTIKFIPWDDDSNITTSYSDITGALRMGIDDIEFIFPDPPAVNLGPDTTICVGDQLLLNAGSSGTSYLWQDGSTDSTYIVMNPGTYWVEVTNLSGTARDTIVVSFIAVPMSALVPYIELCAGDSVILNAGDSGTEYVWNTGATTQQIIIDTQGLYIIELSNECGTITDSSEVYLLDCSVILEMPNVFTPNGDNSNALFSPINSYGIETVEFTIINRWGEVVFESDILYPGWDGNHRGLPCKTGVYFWKIIYTTYENVRSERHGFLNLVR